MVDEARIKAEIAALSGGRAGGIRIAEGRITLALECSDLTAEARDSLVASIKQKLLETPGVEDVRIALTATKRGRTIIAVGSGKGGVGKSTLAAGLAIALVAKGLRVGLVDADIYGPSQAHLLDQQGVRPAASGNRLSPVMSAYGVPFLSMGQMTDPEQAIAWRGPMAGRALEQMVDADWGAVDVLIVDLPPGTGDIQLSMLQKFKPAGAVIVSTPQDLALIDARRAITLFRDAGVPIIGMVENMAGYACPHCGEVSNPFGQGGAEQAAAALNMAFLGRIPLTLGIRQASDAGVPPATRTDGDGAAFHQIADTLATWLNRQGSAEAPRAA